MNKALATFMATVYILKGSKGRYYVGSTDDIERRMLQHNTGHTHTTKRLGDIELVFTQEYESLEKARRVEHRLKSMKRRDYIERIVSEGSIRIQP